MFSQIAQHHELGLYLFFDFLVGVNGQLLFDNGEHNARTDDNDDYFEDLDFVALLKDHVDKEIELLVWNIKSQTQRFITLTPTTNWPGTGLLGVTIRMDDYATAEEKLLRILATQPRSPAAMCGLTPLTDYLLGTTTECFENEEVLGEILEENEDEVLEVYVYNTESDVVRVVSLVPGLKWGGRGLLGAEVGRGYLHRLPKSCRDSLGVSFEKTVQLEEGADVSTPTETFVNEISAHDEAVTESGTGDIGPAAEMVEKEEEVDNVLADKVEVGLDLTEKPTQTENPVTEVEVVEEVVEETVPEQENPTTPMKFPTASIPKLDLNLTSAVLGDLPPPPMAFARNNGAVESEGAGENNIDLR